MKAVKKYEALTYSQVLQKLISGADDQQLLPRVGFMPSSDQQKVLEQVLKVDSYALSYLFRFITYAIRRNDNGHIHS